MLLAQLLETARERAKGAKASEVCAGPAIAPAHPRRARAQAWELARSHSRERRTRLRMRGAA